MESILYALPEEEKPCSRTFKNVPEDVAAALFPRAIF
jgi:hypothetical protein